MQKLLFCSSSTTNDKFFFKSFFSSLMFPAGKTDVLQKGLLEYERVKNKSAKDECQKYKHLSQYLLVLINKKEYLM